MTGATVLRHLSMSAPTRQELWSDIAELRKQLQGVNAQRDELAKVCEKAMEWAAGYPLGGCFSTADGMAAQDVYDACDAALAAVKGD